MPIDSAPQPCPRCQRPTILVSYSWGRQWAHVGTWRPHCGAPAWAPDQDREMVRTAVPRVKSSSSASHGRAR